MTNQLASVLATWFPDRDNHDWVLGTIYDTEGSCYRKPGAMMLVNSLGQQFGLLSGGCLEADIRRQASRVMQTGRSTVLCYDGSDEDDISYRLGIGCGGTVHIMLHPIHADNAYHRLDEVYHALLERGCGDYALTIPPVNAGDDASCFTRASVAEHPAPGEAITIDEQGRRWFNNYVKAQPHLLIAGGGIDAQPVVAIAKQLGWTVSVWDPRPANARADYFPDADELLRLDVAELSNYVTEHNVGAAVLMAHDVAIDAAALSALNGTGLDYMALLGPPHRRAEVLAKARLAEHDLSPPVAGPAGFDIGGELPESIALSILSQCHAVLYQRSASIGVSQRVA
ncbi:isoquinoline 1-oxidoreductase maturation factor [Luminiphilus syltensis NOR5-1B]|uniref:Isoquinoline 1-oxidoreductase maturation factor n=1 Tax=Luminiphilus syltensis NOR5-1B TaxID=565045 RepID=B8KU17_9GAMM|nr:XdhC/CoxI family protein [Luminiphilus syltensis]EED34562.1 isoquinoline 1-oxidoreductase maturation factor [Luminiphilus syltensis NOR5-1B]